MDYLNDFTDDERFVLVSLPLRVGVWMARLDNVKTLDQDEKKENRALMTVLEVLAGAKNAPFVAEVTSATMKGRPDWPHWVQGTDEAGLMVDIQRACRMVDARLPAGTGRSFRGALWRLAKTIAQAYDEENPDDLSTESLIGQAVVVLMGSFEGAMPDDPENISGKEREALKKLRSALKS
jgi:hypothetical protein